MQNAPAPPAPPPTDDGLHVDDELTWFTINLSATYVVNRERDSIVPYLCYGPRFRV